MNGTFSKKAVFGLLVALFLTINVGGIFAADMTNGSAMYNCPNMGAPVLCAMGPLQHLSEWQQTFAAIARQAASETFLLLVLFAAALLSVRPLAVAPAAVKRRFDQTPPPIPRGEKITHWLSLFENSPSQV